MRGQVLEAQPGGGVINGADGNRYTFTRADWKGPTEPTVGTEVDFIVGQGTAGEIFPLPGRTASAASSAASSASYASSSSAAASTAAPVQRPPVRNPGIQPNEGSSVLLGVLGILCIVLAFIIPFLPLIGGLVLGLVGADSAKRYKNANGLVLSRIAWIGSLVLFLVGVLTILAFLIFAWPLVEVILSYIFYVAKNPQTTTSLISLLSTI